MGVTSGTAALQLVQSGECFDCVVVDLEMPGIDGEETLLRLRSLAPEMPVGLWSASDRLETLPPDTLAAAAFVERKVNPRRPLAGWLRETTRRFARSGTYPRPGAPDAASDDRPSNPGSSTR